MKQRNVAAVMMCVCMALAVWLGTYCSFARMYREVERVFIEGEQGDGLSIANDLEERMTEAYNLVTLAKKYMNPQEATIVAVLSARDELIASKSVEEKYRANLLLTQTTTDLYTAMEGLTLSETDGKLRRNVFAQLGSRNDTISNDPYNGLALAYNQKLTAFPANVLSKISFVKSVPLFQ